MMVSLRYMKTITNIVRNFSLSCCIHESTSTKIDSHRIEKAINNKISPSSNSIPYSFDECQRRVEEIKRDGETRFPAGEIAIVRHYSLGKKKRPVLILSSFNHNQNPNATLLIVPFTTKYPNSAIYQWKIFSEETCHRSVVEKNSILIFDYSTLVEYEELETTLDSLKRGPFMTTIQWWKQTVNSILP
ncbi:unnamed protein product [Rotaria sp. Silwood2]|nr:unnamed protein product [Rotaria sp. Silwood2]CAF4499699.1 unnamed protein product [Rotaria sp. Silwood2]